jgi:hypothetical protein
MCNRTRYCSSATLPLLIVFQNVLASNLYVMVEEAVQISLSCYHSLLWTKKQLAIFLIVAGSSWLTYAQRELEWSLQLIELLMVPTIQLQSWPLLPAHQNVLMDVNYHSEIDDHNIVFWNLPIIPNILSLKNCQNPLQKHFDFSQI